MRHKKLIIGTGICLLGIALSAAWFIPCKLEATYAGKTPYQYDAVSAKSFHANTVSLLGRKNPVTPNMRDYNLLDSLGVAPDLERILDYAMLYGATYVELTGNDADIDPLLPTFKWTLDNDILYAILKDGEQMATYFAIGIDFPCHCIVPANFVLGSSDFSACIEDTLRRIASLYPESTTAELYANMGAVPDEKIPEGEEDNWVPVDLGYSIPEILRIENSPKPPLYFKVNPHYEDTLAFKMPYFDMDYLEKHVRPEFDEISEIIPISPEDYQKSIKYEDVCTSARN